LVNFSQEDGEKELVQETLEVDMLVSQQEGSHEGSDIEFDEIVDIDAIQKQLKEQMVELGDAPESKMEGVSEDPILSVQSFEDELEEKMAETFAIVKKDSAEIDSNAKKYVVYIDPDNIAFMENLSVDDRKSIINKILKEQNEQVYLRKKAKERTQFITNIIIITITVIVFFPIMFWGVNKAMEISIANYQTSKENFVRLYKAKGKIKPVSDTAPDDFKY